jgi:conjugative transfer signal peptidase TraF
MPISQPILALAFSLVGVVAIARSALIKTRGARVAYVGTCVAGIVFLGYAIVALDLRFNFTPSMPVGIYRLMPVSPKGEIPRGMVVSACAPLRAAELGRRRAYLAIGACPAHAEPLLKVVAAVPGDELAISADGLAVNGCLLPHSQPLRVDSAGRRLSGWPEGDYRLRPGQLWLYAANNRSWDSRYWGPTPIKNLLAHAMPLVTWGMSGPRRLLSICLNDSTVAGQAISCVRQTRNESCRD